jgi:dodecin
MCLSDTDNIYKTVEITGSSTVDSSDAIRSAVRRASATLRHVEWFEVTSVRGHVEDGEVAHFQVTIKVGFRLE